MDLQRGSIRMPDDAPEAPKFRNPIPPNRPSVPAFNLRLPDDIRAMLDKAAHQNGRSLNAEIVQRLRASLEGYRKF